MAATLDAVNRQRQEVEAGILDEAMRTAEEQAGAGHAAMVISGPDWHPGVVGIVAGRIKERFNRPSCVAGVADNLAKGSGRSVAGIDLGAAVIAARQAGILKTGGGHPMAAGFSLAPDRMSDFHAFLDERLAAAALLPTAADLSVEGTLAVLGATTELAHHLGRLAPFGAGNEEPMLVLQRARVLRADRVGREGNAIRAFVEGRRRRPAPEGDVVPCQRRNPRGDNAGGQWHAAAPGGPFACRGMERCGKSGFYHRRCRAGLTLPCPSATHPEPSQDTAVPFV